MAKLNKSKAKNVKVVSRSMWGDIDEETARRAVEVPGVDRWFLKGYSDKRRENELAARDGTPFTPLKGRLRWVSVQHADGSEDGRQFSDAVHQGYRQLKWDEAKSVADIELQDADGNLISAARKAPDGTIRNGSQMLMYCDAGQAKVNWLRHQQRNAELAAEPRNRVSETIENVNADLGYKGVEEFTEAEMNDQTSE